MIACLLAILGVSSNALTTDGGAAVSTSNYDAGTLAYHVYAATLPDGGQVPMLLQSDGGYVQLTSFPCAKRDGGVPPTALGCLSTVVDGGNLGQDNVMQPGTFSGTKCTPTPCVIFYGDPAP